MLKMGLLKRTGSNIRLVEGQALTSSSIETIYIPLVGTVTCSVPLLATENIEAFVPVSTKIAKSGLNYFLLWASGDSMNEAGIDDWNILLVKQQNSADDGQKVVALINDEATVKVLERRGTTTILRPKSSNKKHKPIILTANCQIQGVVVAILPSDLN